MDKDLIKLVRMSNAVGRDSSLVLGGFGNTSVKTADGKFMHIKASGTALKDMTYKTGWRRLKLDSVLAILKDRTLARIPAGKRENKVTKALLSACDDKFRITSHVARVTAKPSIESCFHSMLDRFVIHLHPAAVLAYGCAKNGRVELEKLFKHQEFPPVWVPYTDPGYMLAKRIGKLTCGYKSQYGRRPAIMFLQNHGLIVTANGLNTALRLVRKVVNTCNNKLKRPKAVRITPADDETIAAAGLAIRRAIFQATGKYMTVKHFIDKTIAGFMARGDGPRLCLGAAVTPDELVYANGPAMWLDKPDRKKILNKLNRLSSSGRELPAGFLIRALGLFVAASRGQLPLVKDVISTYLLVRSFAAGLGGIHPLNNRQRQFIISQKSGA